MSDRMCLECSNIFNISREWKIFCSTMCRINYNKRRRECCFYCGERGNHRDHVEPFSNINFDKDRKYGNIIAGVEYVYSCPECNLLLSGTSLPCIEDRLQFLINKYFDRYKLNKKITEWDMNELEELGPSLKRQIKESLNGKRKAEEKVIYMMAMKQKLEKNKIDD